MQVKYLTFHCSACRPEAAKKQTAADIDAMHRARGFRRIGYHYFVRYDGTVEKGRQDHQIGAHVQNHNLDNIGVCYAGGLDAAGQPSDTRSEAQKVALRQLAAELRAKYPSLNLKGRIKGHRDWSPDLDHDGKVERHEWLKECPCFDVETEL